MCTHLVIFPCLLLVGVVHAQFTVQPVSVVQAEGLEAVFECQFPGATAYGWALDRDVVDPLNPPPGVSVGPGSLSLTVPATQQYNNSVVQCDAQTGFGSTRMFMVSENASLQVDDTEVLHVMNETSTISIEWTSHNFTTNISYCVDINQTTLGSTESVPLDPVCGLTGTQYTFSYPDHTVCDRFSFTVTPTEGGRRGTSSQPDPGFFTQARGVGGVILVSNGLIANEKEVTFSANVTDCTAFVSNQVDSHLLKTPVQNASIIESLSYISLTFSLPTDRESSITVTLTDIHGVDLVFSDLLIKTFDIQEFSANNCSQPNTINVTLEYAMDTSAPGALVCCIPMKDDGTMDVNNAQYSILSRTNDPIERHEVTNVSRGSFQLIVFDIEDQSSGFFSVRPQTTAAAILDTLTIVTGETMTPPHLPMSKVFTLISIEDDMVSLTYLGGSENVSVFAKSYENFEELRGGQLVEDGVIQVNVTGLSGYSIIALSWSNNEFFNARVTFIRNVPADPITPTSSTSVPESETTLSALPSDSILLAASLGVVLVLCLLVLTVISFICVWRRYNHRKDQHVAHQHELTDPESPPSILISTNSYTPESLYSNCLPATTDQQKDDTMFNENDVSEPVYDETTQVNLSSKELQYAELELKTKNDIATDVLSNRKLYASVDMSKLSEPDPAEQSTALSAPLPPTPPRPPTVDSVVAALDNIPERWWDFGKALGIAQHRLSVLRDDNQHDKIRLFHMICYYFNNINHKPKWEEIARALREIGEIEAANKIERVNNLQDCDEDPSSTSQYVNSSWISTRSVLPPISVEESDHDASGTLAMSIISFNKDYGSADDDDSRGMKLSSATECPPPLSTAPCASCQHSDYLSKAGSIQVHPFVSCFDQFTPESFFDLDLKVFPSECASFHNGRKITAKYSNAVQETCSSSETQLVCLPLSQDQVSYKPVVPHSSSFILEGELCFPTKPVIVLNDLSTDRVENNKESYTRNDFRDFEGKGGIKHFSKHEPKSIMVAFNNTLSTAERDWESLATWAPRTIPVKPAKTDSTITFSNDNIPQETVQKEGNTQPSTVRNISFSVSLPTVTQAFPKMLTTDHNSISGHNSFMSAKMISESGKENPDQQPLFIEKDEEEASTESICEANRKVPKRKGPRMWKFRMLPSPSTPDQDESTSSSMLSMFAFSGLMKSLMLPPKYNTSLGCWGSGLQLPKHGLLFQPF